MAASMAGWSAVRQGQRAGRQWVALGVFTATLTTALWPHVAGGAPTSTTSQEQAATVAHLTLSGASAELATFRNAAGILAHWAAQRRSAEQAEIARVAAEQEAARQAQLAAEEEARRAAAAAAAAAVTTSAPPPQPTAGRPATTAAPVAPTTTAAPAAKPPTSPGLPQPPASAVDSQAEARFVALINDARAQAGLGPLSVDPGLRTSARAWAQQLSTDGSLHHQNLEPFLDNWMTAGENIAFGPSVDAMFKALMASPRHYANMVKGDFTSIGVGVVVGSDGKLWTSHVFGG